MASKVRGSTVHCAGAHRSHAATVPTPALLVFGLLVQKASWDFGSAHGVKRADGQWSRPSGGDANTTGTGVRAQSASGIRSADCSGGVPTGSQVVGGTRAGIGERRDDWSRQQLTRPSMPTPAPPFRPTPYQCGPGNSRGMCALTPGTGSGTDPVSLGPAVSCRGADPSRDEETGSVVTSTLMTTSLLLSNGKQHADVRLLRASTHFCEASSSSSLPIARSPQRDFRRVEFRRDPACSRRSADPDRGASKEGDTSATRFFFRMAQDFARARSTSAATRQANRP